MRYLFILILVSVAFVVSCQETAFADLPEIVSPSGTDEFTMVRSGAPYRESYSTAFAPVVDSFQVHRDSIDNYSSYFTAIDLDILSLQILNSAAFDSISWLADTSRAHNVRLLDLESSGGSNYWDRTGTDLSPLNAGDDILLSGNGAERLSFDDVNTQIFETNDGLFFTTVSTYNFSGLFYVNGDVYSDDSSHDLGDPVAYWRYLYTDDISIENTNTIIGRDGSGNMTFVDGVTAIKTLAELAAAGDPTLTHNLVDTLSFTFGHGVGHPYDSAYIFVGANLGEFPSVQDSLNPRAMTANCDGGHFDFQIVTSSTWDDATPTVIFDSSVQDASTTVSSSPAILTLPPDWYIWCIIDGVTDKNSIKSRIHFYYTETRR